MRTRNFSRRTWLVLCGALCLAIMWLPAAVAAQTPQELTDQANALMQDANNLLTQAQDPNLSAAQKDALIQEALAKSNSAQISAQQAVDALLAAANAADGTQAQSLYDQAAQVDGILTQIIDSGNIIAATGTNQETIDNANALVGSASTTQGQMSGLMQTLIALGAVPPTSTPATFTPTGPGTPPAGSPIGPPGQLGQGGIASPT